MNKNRTIGLLIAFTLAFFLLAGERLTAQIVTEPPIPIYLSHSRHQDSMKIAYEKLLSAANTNCARTQQRCDSLEQEIQSISAQNNAHFTWLYFFIALLLLMNIIIFISANRAKKKLEQLQKGQR